MSASESAKQRILIQNATVVLASGLQNVDVLVEGTKILEIGPSAGTTADTVYDASGLHLIPGVIDDQVHFRQPGLEHKEDLHHATRACAKGGVTSFLEMPNTNPNTITVDLLHQKLDLASQHCLVNYGFFIGATPENVKELKAAKRTPGIKIFIGSSTGNLLVDKQAALETIFAETTLPITAHCEDEQTVRDNTEKYAGLSDVAVHSKIRDHKAALISTKRAIDLAVRHNHRFHVLHVSTAAELEVISKHQDVITAEVCPHHLFFNVDDYPRLGSLVQMNPSIKNKEDNEGLWQGLLDGKVQVIATDHAPHTLEEKDQPYPKSPSGLPAVENSLSLILNQVNQGKCTLGQVVQWMCRNPALVWDIKNKGEIKPGFDADLTLVDLKRKHTVRNEDQQTKSGWSPWNGSELQGLPVMTFVMGQKVFDHHTDPQKPWFADSPLGTEITYDHSAGGYWTNV